MATVLITGANRGIGFEFARHYSRLGWKVVAVCRQASQALEQIDVEIVDGVDLAVTEGGERLLSKVGSRPLDLLINNAGILRDEQLGALRFDTIAEQFEVNALAPLRITEALLGNLNEGAKVALITSRMGSIADNTSGGRYGYRMSKAALNAAGKSLAMDLKPKGVAVAILHPGYVATDMVGGHGDITPAVAAERLAQRIDELSLDNTGTFWHSSGELLPW